MSRRGRPALQVFLDSPMAISATEIFRAPPESLRRRGAALFAAGDDPSPARACISRARSADSMAINRINGGAVIMAGSGMATGGRVRHHLRHNLWRREASVIFVGYAAAGTLARQIIDGAETVASSAKRSRCARDPHDQRLLRPCRPGGVIAWQRRPAPSDIPRPRRRGSDRTLAPKLYGHGGGNAGARSGV